MCVEKNIREQVQGFLWEKGNALSRVAMLSNSELPAIASDIREVCRLKLIVNLEKPVKNHFSRISVEPRFGGYRSFPC